MRERRQTIEHLGDARTVRRGAVCGITPARFELSPLRAELFVLGLRV